MSVHSKHAKTPLNFFGNPILNHKKRTREAHVCFPGDTTKDASQKSGEPGSTQEAPRKHPGVKGASEGISIINHHPANAK